MPQDVHARTVYAARPADCDAPAAHCGRCSVWPCRRPAGPALDPNRDHNPPADSTYIAALVRARLYHTWPAMHPACAAIADAEIARREAARA